MYEKKAPTWKKENQLTEMFELPTNGYHRHHTQTHQILRLLDPQINSEVYQLYENFYMQM